MRKSFLFMTAVVIIFLLSTGCALRFVVDQELFDTKRVFQTSQAPGFSMKVAEGMDYELAKDVREIRADLSYVTKIYRFMNNADGYGIVIDMTTIDLAEWGADMPWPHDLGKEVHGKKSFFCGSGYFSEKKNGGQQVKATYKGWMYLPGSAGSSGTTRIVIYYIEPGDQKDNLDGFLARADSRMTFTME